MSVRLQGRAGSDIDLTISGKNLSSNLLYDIYRKVDSPDLPYSSDISLFETLKKEELKEHIRRVGKVFYPEKLLQEE